MPASRNSTKTGPQVSATRRALLGNFAIAAGGLALAQSSAIAWAKQATGLAQAFRRSFRIGVAVSNQALDGQADAQLDLIAREFNSVTAENAMKWGVIRPDGVNWQWQRADRLVDFAGKHGMDVLGHTLVWHSQILGSIFLGADRKPLTREPLLAKMQQQVLTLVGRYRGRFWAWD